jgi:ribose transport system permease protein
MVAIGVVRIGPVLILGIACVLLTCLSPVFLTTANLQNLGVQASMVGILAVGQLLVILTKGVDLSVGSVVGAAGVIGVQLGTHGASAPLVLLAMVGTGLVVGVVNGFLLVSSKAANAIVVTLATLGIARGLALVLSNGQSEFGFPPIVDTLGTGLIGPIPVPVVILAAVGALGWILTRLTQWGTWIYAVGADSDAARRSGIPAKKVLVSVYVICGALAGVAAIVFAGQSGVAEPLAGQLSELDAITAVIIGGASFYGGRGSIDNVIVGALILAVIRNGLNLLSVNPYLQEVAIGVLILVAIQLDALRSELEGKFRTSQALNAA